MYLCYHCNNSFRSPVLVSLKRNPLTDFKAVLHLNTSVCFGCGVLDITLEFPISEMYTGVKSVLFSKCALRHYQFAFIIMQVAIYI